MSILVLQGKGNQRALMENAQLRVQMVGPSNQQSRGLHRRLGNGGMAVEPLKSTEVISPHLATIDIDVLILIVDECDETADLDRLRMWREMAMPFPIIAVAPVEKAPACLDAGADDCVTPNVAPRELEARVRARIRRSDGRTAVVRIRDLEINSQTRSVKRSGREIHLTPRELAILEILAANRGKVVTRVMIWQRLYNETERYASNVVDVYIRYLRQKIDENFSPALIRTVWGRGYMLRGEDEDAVS